MKSIKIITILAIWGLLFGFSLADAQTKFYHNLLVTPAWLEAHLYQPGIVIVHVEETTGPDPIDHYANEHIPEAHFLATESLGIMRGGVNGMLPPLDSLIEMARNLGIDEDTKKIVMYGPTNPAGPARLFHAFDYLGLGDKIALLDGHFPRWKAEDRPTTVEVPVADYSDFVPVVNPQVIIARSNVGDLMSTVGLRRTTDPSLDGRGFILFDSRQDADYSLGHIPGAVQGNPLKVFVGFSEEGDGGINPLTRWLLLPRQAIVERFHDLGLESKVLAITSCRTGIAGSLLYFVLKYAGFKVTLYDGSFNEWSAVMINDEFELEIWETIYPGYAGSGESKLPIIEGLLPWEPVVR